MNESWGYRIKDKAYKSVDFLIEYLVRTAAKGLMLKLSASLQTTAFQCPLYSGILTKNHRS